MLKKPARSSSLKARTYSYDEVLEHCMHYFAGDELAATTWMNKYAMKDENGYFFERSPDEMHERMAGEFARAEFKYANRQRAKGKYLSEYGKKRKPLTEKNILNYFKGFQYLVPQGSVMSALGNPRVVSSLSNCTVLPEVHDSYGGIFFTDQQMAQLFKRRCGVGVDVSSLRPAKMPVSNAAVTTVGTVAFMERFSNTTREVSQDGRRGALMITMDIAHPDVETFITAKQDLKKVTGANISLRISNEFMAAVEADADFTLRFPVDGADPLCTRKVRAKHLWNLIVNCAHRTAEPGMIFWDRQHRYSTSSVYPQYRNISTNPCSEIAMQGGDSCRLMAINLFSLVQYPFTEKAKFNYNKLKEIAYEGMRLMDDLVDLELEAIQRIIKKIKQDPEPAHIKDVELRTWKLLYESGKKGRRTGLGFTALADTIAAMGLAFDSEEALTLVEKIMQAKCAAEFDSSIDMAIERGKFTGFNAKTENTSEFVQMMMKEFPQQYARMMKHGRRNISLSTVAPTGTLSILTRSSSGIEPVFMLSYKRRRRVDPRDKNAKVDFTDALGDRWQEFTVYHPKLSLWMDISGRKDPDKSPYHNSTAPEIQWKKRVQMQAVVQRYTTHSISSTVNLPENTEPAKISDIFIQAWKKGLKGITIYREGSRSGVLLPPDEEPSPNRTSYIVHRTLKCEVCGAENEMVNEEGCFICKSCGQSKCS